MFALIILSLSLTHTLSLTLSLSLSHSLSLSIALSLSLSSFSLVPGPVGHITAFPSFFMITITWEEPEMRNGIIANYEVVYGPKDSPQFIITEDVTAGTTFTTPDDLERGAEYTFTVTAHTSVGPGEPTTVNYFTLERPRKNKIFCMATFFSMYSCCRRSEICVTE